MNRTAAYLMLMLGLSITARCQVELLLPDGQPEIDTTLTDLSYHNIKLLDKPLGLNLSTDDEVAQIRADHWVRIDIGTLPEYRMPIYEPHVTSFLPLAPIDPSTRYTLLYDLRVVPLSTDPPAENKE